MVVSCSRFILRVTQINNRSIISCCFFLPVWAQWRFVLHCSRCNVHNWPVAVLGCGLDDWVAIPVRDRIFFFLFRSSPDRVWGLPSFMAVDTECLFPMRKVARTWFYFHLVSKLWIHRAVHLLNNTFYEAGTFGCKTIFYGSSIIKWCRQRLEFHYKCLSRVHIPKFLRSTYTVPCPKSHLGFRLSSRCRALVLPTFCKFPALHIMRERERVMLLQATKQNSGILQDQ